MAKKLTSILKAVEKANSNLDMSKEARMARAKEQGFDVDTTYYHGTNADFDEFDPSRVGDRITSLGRGHYFTPNKSTADEYGRNIIEARLSGKNILDWQNIRPEQRGLIESKLMEVVPDSRIAGFGKKRYEVIPANDEGAKRLKELQEKTKGNYHHDARAQTLTDDDIIKNYDGLIDEIGANDDVVEWREGGSLADASGENLMSLMNEYRPELARELGYDGARFGDQIAIFDPKNIRSTNAAFDPDKKDSSNLLASIGAGTVAGGAALSSDEAEAGVINGIFSKGGDLARKADFITNMKATEKIPATDEGFSLQETWLDYIDDPIANKDADSLNLTLSELSDKYKKDISDQINDPEINVDSALDYYSKVSGNFDNFLKGAQDLNNEAAFQAKTLLNQKNKSTASGLAGGTAALGATGLALTPEEAEASFIGQAAKTFSKEALGLAKKMTDEGASRDEIWQATGQMGSPTFKDVDGRWKQEISNDRALLNTAAGNNIVSDFPSAKQSDFIKDEGLYAAYPDLKDLEMGYTPEGEAAYISLGNGRGQVLQNIRDMQSPEDVNRNLSNNLHEVQHAIQEGEGFSYGGNPSQFDDVKDELSSQRFKEIKPAIAEIKKQLSRARKEKKALKSIPQTPEIELRIKELENERLSLRAESERLQESAYPENIAFSQYERLAGEAEARNVQTRLDYDMDKRVENPPWNTLDVPEEELIVRGNTGGASSFMEVKKADEAGAKADTFINTRQSKAPTARRKQRDAQRAVIRAKQAEERKAQELADQIGESLEQMDFNRQSIEAPSIPAFQTGADWVAKYNRALKGSPAEYLIGAEGLEEYLRKAAYGEANMLDRGIAVAETGEIGALPAAGMRWLKNLTN